MKKWDCDRVSFSVYWFGVKARCCLDCWLLCRWWLHVLVMAQCDGFEAAPISYCIRNRWETCSGIVLTIFLACLWSSRASRMTHSSSEFIWWHRFYFLWLIDWTAAGTGTLLQFLCGYSLALSLNLQWIIPFHLLTIDPLSSCSPIYSCIFT